MSKLLKYFSNVFADLKNYDLNKFKSDLNAGVVTGIIAIPLSLALAIATGNAAGVDIPPIWGLYTAAMAGMIAAVFAGSRYSVSGPAAAMVPILGAVIKEHGINALPFIGIISGFFLLIFGLLKVGNFIKFVPLPITLGFTAGIAITLFFGQLNSFLGLKGVPNHEHFHEKVMATFEHLNTVNLATLLVGLLSLAILIGMPYIKKLSKVPPSLVAVVGCTALVYFGTKYFPSLHLNEVATIADKYGNITVGFPPIRKIEFTNFAEYIAPGLKIAFLIAIESLLCAVVADKMTKTKHNSNQELISQGISNMLVPFFTGIPSTAVIARTGTIIKNGAHTRIASFLHGLLVLVFLLALAPLGSKIPLTVLSTVLFITAWKISEQKEIRHLIKLAPNTDLFVLALTLLLTVFMDLTVAVGAGMFLLIVLIFKRLSNVYVDEIDESDEFVSEEVRDLVSENPNIQFFNIEGNLSMGGAGNLPVHTKIKSTTEIVIIRLREVHYIDLSGLDVLHEFILDLKAQGKKVYLVSINKRIRNKMLKFKIDQDVDKIIENTKVLLANFN